MISFSVVSYLYPLPFLIGPRQPFAKSLDFSYTFLGYNKQDESLQIFYNLFCIIAYFIMIFKCT